MQKDAKKYFDTFIFARMKIEKSIVTHGETKRLFYVFERNLHETHCLHFLCLSCKRLHSPERNARLKKQKRTASVSNSKDHSKTENAASKPPQPLPSPPPATPPCPRQSPMAARAPTPEIKAKHDDDFQEVPKKVCHHYKNSKCQFGMKGNGCKFDHPKRCRKLMNHGTKAGKGCNLGINCNEFHPKMCPMSITKGLIQTVTFAM